MYSRISISHDRLPQLNSSLSFPGKKKIIHNIWWWYVSTWKGETNWKVVNKGDRINLELKNFEIYVAFNHFKQISILVSNFENITLSF